VSLALACFWLPESRPVDRHAEQHKLLDLPALADSLAVPSIAALLLTTFVCVFSFANFETTLSLVIKGEGPRSAPFHFSFRQVCLTFAYIGFVLATVQGLLVRRLSGRISEAWMAAAGAGLEISGFLAMTRAIQSASQPLLLGAVSVVVAGFALLNPSLNSLISRRSDPDRQGGVLGVTQSINSLARIVGSALGIPLLRASLNLPFLVAAGLMALGLALVLWAGWRGRDYPTAVDSRT
jgi:hypothetical protein